MAVKRTKTSTNLDTLKSDISGGAIRSVYLFHGEETYLRDHYLDTLRGKLIPVGCETFNEHCLDGKTLTVRALTETVEALPMMCERTMVVVTDFDLFKLDDTGRDRLAALLLDMPPYCCLVFVYDLLPYQPDKRKKKFYGVLEQCVLTVRFDRSDPYELNGWVARRFHALGKEIDRGAAEHLIFTCGTLMTGLISEIEKIAAYTTGTRVTRAEIDAVADPVIDAVIFDLTNAIARRSYDTAADTLSRLLKMQEDPIAILALIGRELRKIYTARLLLDSGGGRRELMEIWQMRSEYPARLLFDAAQGVSLQWCRDAVLLCRDMDMRMKSQGSYDSREELKFLLMRLAQGTRR